MAIYDINDIIAFEMSVAEAEMAATAQRSGIISTNVEHPAEVAINRALRIQHKSLKFNRARRGGGIR